MRKIAGLFIVLALIHISSSSSQAAELKISTQVSKATEPEKIVTFVFTIENMSPNKQVCSLKGDFPEKWEAMITPSALTLEPFEKTSVFVSLFVSSLVSAGDYPVGLFVLSLGPASKVLASATTLVRVKQSFAVELICTASEKAVKRGGTANFLFSVSNEGNSIEEFQVLATSASGWKSGVSESLVKLNPGEQREISIKWFVPKDAQPKREPLDVVAVSKTDPSVFKELGMEVFVLPPPLEKVGGTLNQEIPLGVSLERSGSLEEKETSSELRFNSSADFPHNKWFNFSLTAPYEKERIEGEKFTLDFGKREIWQLTLGDFSSELGELSTIEARGAKFETIAGHYLNLLLAGGEKEKIEHYAISLDSSLGNKIELGANYSISPAEEINISEAKLGLNLASDWNISGEYARSEKMGIEDSGYIVSQELTSPHFTIEGEYLSVGIDYAGSRADEEGYEIGIESRPFSSSLLTAQVHHSRDNVNRDPAMPTLEVDALNLSATTKLGGPFFAQAEFGQLRGTSGWNGELLQSDMREEKYSLGVGCFLKPFSLFYSEKWGQVQDYAQGLEFSLPGYEAGLSIESGKLSASFDYSEETISDLLNRRALKGIDTSVSLGYELVPERLSLLLSYERNRELGDGTDVTSLTAQYTPNGITSFFCTIEKEDLIERDERKTRWKYKVGIGKRMSLGFPGIKDKGRIQGLVFLDNNKNGIQDEEEKGVSDVMLIANAMSAVSNKEGRFKFFPMRPDRYTIRLENLPDTFMANIPLPQRVELKAGETLEISIPLVETAAVNGYVFNDENKNEEKDHNERGIYEVRVTLMGPKGISRETFTNLNGQFSFGVAPGEYEVKVDPRYLPERSIPTTKMVYTIRLQPGQRVFLPFGVFQKPRSVILTFSPPYADFAFSPESPEVGEIVHFDASESRATKGIIMKYEWDFDADSRPDSTGKETKYSFASPGKHLVTLTVVDSNHYKDLKTKMVVVVEKGGE